MVVESLGGADRIDAGVRPPSPHEGKEILQVTSGGIEGRQHADIAVGKRELALAEILDLEAGSGGEVSRELPR